MQLKFYSPHVQDRRVHVDQRDAGETADNGHKPVQVARTKVPDRAHEEHDADPSKVLEPLDGEVPFAGHDSVVVHGVLGHALDKLAQVARGGVVRRHAEQQRLRLGAHFLLGVLSDLSFPSGSFLVEEVVFKDFDGREQLQRRGQQDGDRVAHLDDERERGLREVEQDHCLDVVAKAQVRDRGQGDKDHRHHGHHQHHAHEQRPCVTLEHGYFGRYAVEHQMGGGTEVDVDESEQNERVGDQRRETELADVSCQGQR
ncbi:hypothetical protein OGAPHI_002406 [Ogataea philodendri]|uniref:Uncharacterized protein n=1 Tax=Ogataea philodendri TaxID=1378263 RepID=A0A9P8PCA2_9ASCO|nr:uncharacterized protein OGAPHI_002406 [Ogataea philodendri]KAH3668652.1 hypothetical protein OGAPHI_002406 [Ogataea philodendri]